jgi:hypothetical protein
MVRRLRVVKVEYGHNTFTQDGFCGRLVHGCGEYSNTTVVHPFVPIYTLLRALRGFV